MNKNINYTIRQATTDDLESIASIYTYSWKYAYKGIVPQDFLDNLEVQKFVNSNQGRDFSATYLFELNGKVVGLSRFGEYREKSKKNYSDYAEIVTMYFLPDYIGKGLGSLFLDWIINKLRCEYDYKHCIIWVLEDNIRAQAAYKKAGFIKSDMQKELVISEKELTEVAYILDL